MARTVTLEDLRDGALDVADELNSGVISPETANRWINQAYAKYYDLLIASGEDYSVRQQVIVTNLSTDPAATNDPATYKLPGDFYELKGMEVNLGGSQYCTIHRTNWNDRNRYREFGVDTGWSVGGPIGYMILDNFIRFDRNPQGSYTITLWYYPVAPVLGADAQTVDVLSGGDLFIELYAAGMIAQRQESFELADRLFLRAEEELQRAKDMASSRDAGEPPTTTEVHRRSLYGWRGGRY